MKQAIGVNVNGVDYKAEVEPRLLLVHYLRDVLGPDWDAREAVRRLVADPSRMVGETLMDQRVMAGPGNIYRSEALYVCGHNPWTSQSQLADEELVKLVECAANVAFRELDPGDRLAQRLQ